MRWLAGARHLPVAAVTFAFVVSRLVYRGIFGVRFDTSPFGYFIQYIDPWFVEHDFWRSMLYLHQQAPLQNLVVGAAWKYLGPSIGFALLDAVYLATGYAFALVLLALLRRLGVGPLLATIATIAFTASPFFALYEAWMFYPLPVACLLATAALALLRFYREGTFRAASIFFWVLAATALIRNIYGIVWLAAVVALLLLRPPVVPLGGSPRRILLKAVAAPALLIWGVSMMPTILIGPRASSSAAAWANIGFRTYHGLPAEERQRLRDDGTLSGAFDLEPFSPVPALKAVRVPHEPTGVPLLDMAMTPAGRPNHFTLEYLLIADRYLKPEGKLLVSRYPHVYVKSVLDGLRDWYFSPPTRDLVFSRTANRRRLYEIEHAIGKLAGANARGRYLALVVALPAAFLFGAWTILRRRSVLASQRSTVALVAFMLMTITYVTLGTTMISYGDYSRYRFDVDAFYFVLGVLLVERTTSAAAALLRRLRMRRSAARASVPSSPTPPPSPTPSPSIEPSPTP